MKPAQLFIAVFLLLIFNGCKKEVISPEITQNSFIDSAVQFLKSSMQLNDFSTLDLKKTTMLRYKDKNIGIQIFENTSTDKFVVLKKAGNAFSGNWVDLSDLQNKNSAYDTWTLKLTTLNKKTTNTFIVKNNKVVPNNNLSTSSPVLPEVIIYYDPDSYDNNMYSMYWFFNQDADYYDMYLQPGIPTGDNTSGGNYGSGIPYNNVVVLPKFNAPEAPIAKLEDELKCFTIDPSATYTITVNVNQPSPNTRDKIDPAAEFIVGHTYLTMDQINANGSRITRNIGFYPKNTVKPGSTNSPSEFGDDSYTPSTVSLQISVSGSEMNTVINTLEKQQSVNYDMNTFNCVNSAMQALGSIDVNLPASKSGDQTLFSGYNPGDLGQDIRGLNLDNFSRDNGNRKVVRTASSNNDQEPGKKVGTC